MPVANSYYKILLGINDAKNSLRTPTNRVLNIEKAPKTSDFWPQTMAPT